MSTIKKRAYNKSIGLPKTYETPTPLASPEPPLGDTYPSGSMFSNPKPKGAQKEKTLDEDNMDILEELTDYSRYPQFYPFTESAWKGTSADQKVDLADKSLDSINEMAEGALKQAKDAIDNEPWISVEHSKDPKDEPVGYALQWEDTVNHTVTSHGVFPSADLAIKSIRLWWGLNDFNPIYVRMWEVEGVTTVDYGSHVYFYKITRVTKDTIYSVLEKGYK